MIVSNSDRQAVGRVAGGLGLLGSIDFLDVSLERLPSLISSADIAVNPRTHCPGVPQKLLNYMAAGAAVVSFAGSAKHLVHDQTALVVADDDIPAFTSAMGRLLDDDVTRRRLGAEARLYARQHLSWEQCAAICEGVYERLLTQSGPRSGETPPKSLDDEEDLADAGGVGR